MTGKRLVSAIVAVCSVWLGGSLGAAALEKANAAPLAGRASVAEPSTLATPARRPHLEGPTPA